MFRKNNPANRLIIFGIIIVIIIIFGLVIYNYYSGRRIAREAKWLPRAEKKLTLIAGWNLKNLNSYLINQGFNFSPSLLELRAKDYATTYDFLADAPKSATLEGYIFPDTYRVYASSTLAEILAKPLKKVYV